MVAEMTSVGQATVIVAEGAPGYELALAEALGAAGYLVQVLPEASLLATLRRCTAAAVVLQVADRHSLGYELCRQIRSAPDLTHLPVLFVGSFQPGAADPNQVFAVGGSDYLSAPWQQGEVVARLGHQLGRSQSRDSLGVSPPEPAPDARPPLLKASLQRIHNSLDLDIILDTAVRDVQQQTQADRVVIYQFHSSGRGVVTHEAVADVRLSVLHRQVEDACFDVQHAAKYWSGWVGQIDDIATLGTTSQCYREMLRSFDVQANLVVPIIHNLVGQNRYLWGLIVLHQCRQPRRWLPSEIELLQELSAHLAIAIQQSRLFEQVRRQARQEMLLNQILDEIRSSLDVQKILTGAIEHLRAALNLRQCGIALLHHNLANLPVPFTVSLDQPGLAQPVPPLSITDSLRRQMLREGDLAVSSYLTNPALARQQLAQPVVQNDITYLVAALRTDGQVQGLLWACPNLEQEAAGPSRGDTWDASNLRLLEEVALQLSQALHQADLYQQLQTANDELQRLAHLDGLTQIANRREFDRYLAQEWQRLQREQGSLALILADVDYFKGFNDTYGHLAGDDCLRSIGRLLNQVTKRPADLAARYGGEEFALILPNTTPSGAIALASAAQTYLNRLAIPNRASPLYGQVTLSFGITALVPQAALSLEVLMHRADQALYAAKSSGRNRYCLWSEAIELGQSQSNEKRDCR
jgi:diguanylate cyclase (GGDEF)-like protein